MKLIAGENIWKITFQSRLQSDLLSLLLSHRSRFYSFSFINKFIKIKFPANNDGDAMANNQNEDPRGERGLSLCVPLFLSLSLFELHSVN